MLSVCCLAGGPPGRLVELLGLLRPVADEIVVAVDDRIGPERLERAAGLADRLIAFPYADPMERSLAWLHALCTGEWVFRIDDDEVPSRALLDLLRAPDERLSHVWTPRRWLWGDDRWLAGDPWAPDWQLRLTRRDAARFPGRTHIPVRADGAHAYLDAPIYHLDLVVNDFAHRAEKAERYERSRPGLRIGGLPFNVAYYLPELRDSVETEPVPESDATLVHRVVNAAAAPIGRAPKLATATREEIDASWAERPLAETDYAATVALGRAPSLIAGELREIDVRVTNLGGATWPGGHERGPEIRLSYRWRGLEQPDEQLRTPLPHDLTPGETVLVPMAFRAPCEPGVHEIVVDLVHERQRWFDAGAVASVHVHPRLDAVVLVGQPPGDPDFDHLVDEALARIDPAYTPILVGPKDEWLRDRFGIEAMAEPPRRADKVLIVPAGARRERLRLRREAYRLRLASRAARSARQPRIVEPTRLLVRASTSVVLALLTGIDRLG